MKSGKQTRLRGADAGELLARAPGLRLERMALQVLNWVRRSGNELMRRSSSRRLRVVETVNLGEKRFVSIVQVDGEQFLLGGSASGVAMLAKLESPPREQKESSQHTFADFYSVAQQRPADFSARLEESAA